MALQMIFVPLWILDSCLLALPVGALAIAVAKRRRSALIEQGEGMTEATAFFALVLCFIAPWICFEVLLCFFIEGTGGVPAWAAFIPLLFWLCLLWALLLAYATTRRSVRPRPDDEGPDSL